MEVRRAPRRTPIISNGDQINLIASPIIDQRRVDVSRTSSNVSCSEFCLPVGRSVGSVVFSEPPPRGSLFFVFVWVRVLCYHMLQT